MFVMFCCRSPANVRGIFKIPQLTTQHFNMDVYSQVDDRNDNSYEEVNAFTCHKCIAIGHLIPTILNLFSDNHWIFNNKKLHREYDETHAIYFRIFSVIVNIS